MSDKKSFYITTTLPYVNAEPHIGFALEVIQADALARYWRSSGHDVFFSTGTDEHGQKVFEAAEKNKEDVKKYTDRYADEYKKLGDALNLSHDAFIRTTDEHHIKAAQEMWKRCEKDIYKKEFEGQYRVGCERFLAQRDLTDGKCLIHGTEPQELKEENWFFNFKKYEKPLLEYLENPKVIIPDWRRAEAINFVKEGLEDFSVSREKSRLSWGIPVPGDDSQVMYVWFDALTNYISTLDWPNEGGVDLFEKFWNKGHTVQMAGKDQVRFQSLMWQAMLMSAGIKNTGQIFYHGFITSGGQKMSKSLGNVISPYDLVKKYGTDATRYLLLRHVNSTEDTDVTWERLDEWYTAGLVNGLGNLVSRILTMAENYKVTTIRPAIFDKSNQNIESFNFQEYMNHIWDLVQKTDKKIQNEEPYKKYKTEQQVAINIVSVLCTHLSEIAYLLEPVMPKTAEIIHDSLRDLRKPKNLFPRLNA